MKKKLRYNNVLLYSSLQFTGNIEEYFSQNCEKLVSYIIVPRANYTNNLVRLYKNGTLVSEEKFTLSQNILVYYVLILFYQIRFLLKYFKKNETIVLITFHPISFFFMSIQKLVRKVIYVYWVADYFPPVNTPLRLFERLKSFYNTRVDYVCYLSDTINELMNKKILHTNTRQTVMWGIIPKDIKRSVTHKKFTMLFVGVIRDSQGLEFLFEFLKNHRQYFLNIIGDCDDDLYKKYQRIIGLNKITNNVFFPNRFYSLAELESLSKTCQIGVALYDTDKTNATFYTDPGKVKTYTQLGLPVIMSNTSAIALYISKYTAGILVEKNQQEFSHALVKIQANYDKYTQGVARFNDYFSYDHYYGKSFTFMEQYE